MVYATPVSPEQVTGRFDADRSASYYLSPAKLAGDFAPSRYARELRLFQRHCPGGRVLDAGCSTGAFLHQLQKTGAYDGVGTDVALAALDHAAGLGIHVERTPFLESDFGGRRFDAVTFWAVLEHLAGPGAFLKHAAALLRPGGLCFALVPNLDSLGIRILGWRHRQVMADHLNYFTAATLRQMAVRTGSFGVVEIQFTHFNPVVIWQDLWRGGRATVPEPARARLLQRTTALKQNPWMTPARTAYQLAEAALASAGLADNVVIVLRKTGLSASGAGSARNRGWPGGSRE